MGFQIAQLSCLCQTNVTRIDSGKRNAWHDIGTARAAADCWLVTSDWWLVTGDCQLPTGDCSLSSDSGRREGLKCGGGGGARIHPSTVMRWRRNCQFHQSRRVTFGLPLRIESYIFCFGCCNWCWMRQLHIPNRKHLRAAVKGWEPVREGWRTEKLVT